jgi:hypothetical protein
MPFGGHAHAHPSVTPPAGSAASVGTMRARGIDGEAAIDQCIRCLRRRRGGLGFAWLG